MSLIKPNIATFFIDALVLLIFSKPILYFLFYTYTLVELSFCFQFYSQMYDI